jgi:DNA-binding IscR family transcriptional regulator
MLLRRDRALMAIDIVLDVAFHAGRGTEVTGAAEIADRLGAQRRGIEPLLQALTRAELLDSTRGPKGGYRLAARPRAMPLIEVIEAVLDTDESRPRPPAGSRPPSPRRSGRSWKPACGSAWRR